LPMLHYRWIRDVIETYRILNDKYDLVAVPNLITSTILTARDNNFKTTEKSYKICFA